MDRVIIIRQKTFWVERVDPRAHERLVPSVGTKEKAKNPRFGVCDQSTMDQGWEWDEETKSFHKQGDPKRDPIKSMPIQPGTCHPGFSLADEIPIAESVLQGTLLSLLPTDLLKLIDNAWRM